MASKSSSARQVATMATATAKTRSVIEGLQARLSEATKQTSTSPGLPAGAWNRPDAATQQESEEELEKQLQAYFARAVTESSEGDLPAESRSRNKILSELRDRVIEGVVDRIFKEWSRPQGSFQTTGLAREITDRLIDRVLEEVRTSTARSLNPSR
jgi:hypothetical protein